MKQLAAESGRAGMRVRLREEVGGAVPDLAGRTAYRIVQEAPDQRPQARPRGRGRRPGGRRPGEGLTVEVCNQAPGAAGTTHGRAVPTPDGGPAAPTGGPGRGWPSGSPWPTGGSSAAPPPGTAGGWRPGYPARHDRIRAPIDRGAGLEPPVGVLLADDDPLVRPAW